MRVRLVVRANRRATVGPISRAEHSAPRSSSPTSAASVEHLTKRHASAHLLGACIDAGAIHAGDGARGGRACRPDLGLLAEAPLGEVLPAALAEWPAARSGASISASRTFTTTGPPIASQRADSLSPSVTPTIRAGEDGAEHGRHRGITARRSASLFGWNRRLGARCAGLASARTPGLPYRQLPFFACPGGQNEPPPPAPATDGSMTTEPDGV